MPNDTEKRFDYEKAMDRLASAKNSHEALIHKTESLRKQLRDAEVEVEAARKAAEDAEMEMERCKPLRRNELNMLKEAIGKGTIVEMFTLNSWGRVNGDTPKGKAARRLKYLGFVEVEYQRTKPFNGKVKTTALGIEKLEAHRSKR